MTAPRKAKCDLGWIEEVQFRQPKSPVYLRLDKDIIAYFRRGGGQYQSRINQVLRAYVSYTERHST